MRTLLALIFALLTFPALAQVSATPPAVIADPSADGANPPAMDELTLSSHGSKLNGLIYVAEGAGPHPAVILLHGFPGYEQNLDLAQSIRRAGWDVLFFHYRGSWGSQGSFSFVNSIEDTQAAIAWIRDPNNAKKYRIDSASIVLIGHSMGGFMAAAGTAKDSAILGAGMLAAWNIGADGKRPERFAKMKDGFADEMGPLAGCTPDGLIAEMKSHGDDWNYNGFAPRLKDRAVLVISTNDGLGPDNDAFVAAMKSAGASHVTTAHFPSDHGFSDHRIAMQTAVIEWLQHFKK